MTKTRSTKRALLMSGFALLMCVSMLIGSTFAWFTDSVTSAGNKIVAGTLDIQLLMDADLDGEYDDISDSTAPIFGAGSIAQNNNAETLWEPGKTQVAYLAIKNNGNLALKYTVGLDVQNVSKDLYKVMKYAIVADADKEAPVTAWNGGNAVTVGTQSVAGDVSLAVGATHYFALAIHMDEEAGNEYQNGEVNFDLTILATQDTVESDSFGDQYDVDATYPAAASSVLPENRTEPTAIKAGDVTVEIPADAPAGNYKLTVDNTSVDVDEDGNSVANFEINLTRDGKSVNSDGKEYTITIFVAKGLNPDTTKLYHKGVDITSSIINASPVDGTVTFKTDSFSPFAVAYKVDCDIFVEQNEQTKIKTIYVFTADGFEQLNKMMADKTAGKYAVVKLCANIDMTGKTWTPVDSHADTAFYLSEFDGQGFTISNLTIKGQAMFTRFAGFGDVTVKDVTFYNATVDSTSLNSSILTVQTYQNLHLNNVDVKNSSITGTYKVAPLVATVYDEKESSIVCTVKNCDVSDTVVTSTVYDFFTCGMISFVYTTNNDFVEYENCSITNVLLRSAGGGYDYHANIHYTSADTDDQINEHPGVKVTNVTFEKIN